MLKDFSLERFDIVIQAGQSNAFGTGFGPAAEPYAPDSRVLCLHRDFMVVPAAETVDGNRIRGNFSLAFAREYLRAGLLAQGRRLLIIRAALGSTSFSGGHWGLGDPLFLGMMELLGAALALNPANRAAALLWHQGENDAGTLDGGAYARHLTDLVHAVREACPGLPFIAGDFVPQWKRESGLPPGQVEAIVSAQRAICGGLGRAAFVETHGLLSNAETLGGGDKVHFCRDALNQLGARYFGGYRDVTLL